MKKGLGGDSPHGTFAGRQIKWSGRPEGTLEGSKEDHARGRGNIKKDRVIKDGKVRPGGDRGIEKRENAGWLWGGGRVKPDSGKSRSVT